MGVCKVVSPPAALDQTFNFTITPTLHIPPFSFVVRVVVIRQSLTRRRRGETIFTNLTILDAVDSNKAEKLCKDWFDNNLEN